METPDEGALEWRDLNDETVARAAGVLRDIRGRMEIVVRGRSRVIDLVLTALVADGHVLLEDYPGSGKTTLAKMLASSIGGGESNVRFNRIQFTPDVLPSDILGVSLWDAGAKSFRFSHGPIFGNFILADEINRAGPKVQSALLEAMAEKQVTVDNHTHRLPDLFQVIATQNPLDMAGTWPLPLTQLDRFLMRIRMGELDADTELEILRDHRSILTPEHGEPVCDERTILGIQKMAAAVHIDDRLLQTINHLVQRTRSAEETLLGASTRGALALVRVMKAHALVHGRGYVTPEDLSATAEPVILHRLLLREGIRDGDRVFEEWRRETLERLSALAPSAY